MGAASSCLQDVRRAFRSHGITNDVQITGAVAFLLLVREQWGALKGKSGVNLTSDLAALHAAIQRDHPGLEHVPRPPDTVRFGTERLGDLITSLEDSLKASPHVSSLGEFYQREIRFEFLKEAHGEQYPTPHHIADFMAALAIHRPDPEVFDPAAGTAGLLAATLKHVKLVWLTGCDFDPAWSELGAANLLLHGAEHATMHLGSSLGYYQTYADHFDCVLMNPPFGGSRSAEEVSKTVGSRFGRTTSTVLSALALHTLKPGGFAAFLCPTGLLFGGGGEAKLRALLTDNALEAIITMPPDAFQPHSQVAAHLVVIRKRNAEDIRPKHPIWFCSLVQDGYAAGAGRDLTLEPIAANNELPRTEELVLSARKQAWSVNLNLPGGGQVQAVSLRSNPALPGIAVQATADATVPHWQVACAPSGASVMVNNDANRLLAWLFVPFDDSSPIALAAEHAKVIQWSALLPASAWAPNIIPKWTGEADDVAIEITDSANSVVTVTSGKTNYHFSKTHDGSSKACIIDAQGFPLSPWLSIREAADAAKVNNEEFGTKFAASAILDGTGMRCGWIMHLSATAEGATEEHEAWLLITNSAEAKLLCPPQNEPEAFALADSGWLHLVPGPTPRLSIASGTPVTFRAGIRLQGFALGPAPAESTGYRVFGALIARDQFEKQQADGTYQVDDLQPRRFLPEQPSPPAPMPADVIADIRKNQGELSVRINYLTRIITGTTTRSSVEPSAVQPDNLFADLLDSQQEALWSIIQGKRDSKGKPEHFDLTRLQQWCRDAGHDTKQDDLEQQVNLFLRLGLLLETSVGSDDVYRACIAGDFVDIEKKT